MNKGGNEMYVDQEKLKQVDEVSVADPHSTNNGKKLIVLHHIEFLSEEEATKTIERYKNQIKQFNVDILLLDKNISSVTVI